MKCPKCKKKISIVVVESKCTQEGSLKGNKIEDYTTVQNIEETLAIYCRECGANITDWIKEK